MFTHLRHWLCGLRWDHGVLKIENGRYLLVCDSCGWRSSGVTVTSEGWHRAQHPTPSGYVKSFATLIILLNRYRRVQ